MIGRQKIDPSIAFAFYIKNLNELSELIEKIDKVTESLILDKKEES